MLTIEFTIFWPEQQALKQECIDFMAMNAGDADRIAVHCENLPMRKIEFKIINFKHTLGLIVKGFFDVYVNRFEVFR